MIRGKLITLIILAALCGFLNFFNNNKIVNYTRRLARVEKSYNAEKNINTELLVAPDHLTRPRNLATLLRVEMSQFIPEQDQGRIVYVHEPSAKQEKSGYCIIDLFASRAEAKNLSIILD